MASNSGTRSSQPTLEEAVMNIVQYPSPLARYEEVVVNVELFLATLQKFHASMGTKFRVPVIGGKELDLHRLFVEVTSRGGIEKVISERKWNEVTATFDFPSSATNASFLIRKFYQLLLYHYEQLYFKAIPAHWTGTGVIDGKFDGGYLVTVTIGMEKLKGILYQTSQDQVSHSQHEVASAKNSESSNLLSGTKRRRRRKHEIKRRDPDRPKHSRSGYNFFFAEQYARLKPHHPGKEKEVTRMIGELWNNLSESEKAVYQEKSVRDKERYKTEMEDYRKRLKSGTVTRDAVPIQQMFPKPDRDTRTEADMEGEVEGGESLHTMSNKSSSSESGCEYAADDDDKTV